MEQDETLLADAKETVAPLLRNYLCHLHQEAEERVCSTKCRKWTCRSITLSAFLRIFKQLEKTTTHLGKILGIKVNATLATPLKTGPTENRNQRVKGGWDALEALRSLQAVPSVVITTGYRFPQKNKPRLSQF